MKIKLLSSGAKIPTRAENGAAGYDLYVPQDTTINPGRNIVPLNISMAIPTGYEGQIRPRSGFSAKGMEGYPATGQGQYDPKPQRYDADVIIGTIDSSFRGTVGVLVKSYEKEAFYVAKGTRIAQLVIEKHLSEEFEVVDSLDETERGTGGFGSTGTN